MNVAPLPRFVPLPKVTGTRKVNIRLEFSEEQHAEIARLAKAHNCTIKGFLKQATAFAIERLEKKK